MDYQGSKEKRKESYEEWEKRTDMEIEDLKKTNRFDWDLINYLIYTLNQNIK